MKKPIKNSLLTAIALHVLTTFGQSTQIKLYQAYSRNNVLNPNVVVAQHYTGTCWTRSVANPGRPDAWRCISSNLILDPCFQDGSTILACIISPWSHKASLLEVNTPLYKSPILSVNTNKASPWALELANGKMCTLLTGSSFVINNTRINYTCDNSKFSVIGDIDKTSDLWKANVYDFKKNTIKIIAIETAWY